MAHQLYLSGRPHLLSVVGNIMCRGAKRHFQSDGCNSRWGGPFPQPAVYVQLFQAELATLFALHVAERQFAEDSLLELSPVLLGARQGQQSGDLQ